MELGCKFFTVGFLSQTLTIHRAVVKEREPSLFQLLKNIQIFICSFASGMITFYFLITSHEISTLLLDETIHLLKIEFGWMLN